MKVFLRKIAATSEQQAHFVPAYDDDKEVVDKVENDQIVSVEMKRPRNPGQHRKFFVLLNKVKENLPDDAIWQAGGEMLSTKHPQAVIKALGPDLASVVIFINSVKDILDFIKFKTGHYERKYMGDKAVNLELKSISFESMAQDEFDQLYQDAVNICLKYFVKIENEEQRQQFEYEIAMNF